MARLSYIKVVEFQRRGLVHLHVVLRADGAGRPERAAAALARRRASSTEPSAGPSPRPASPCPTSAGTALRRARWGAQHRRPGARRRRRRRRHGHRRLRGQVRHQDRRRDGRGWPTGSARRAQIERLGCAPTSSPWCARPGPSAAAGSWRTSACATTPTPSATAASSPPRASRFSTTFAALRAGPGRLRPAADGEDRLRLRRRVALRRPGLRRPRGRRAWPHAARGPPRGLPRGSRGSRSTSREGSQVP